MQHEELYVGDLYARRLQLLKPVWDGLTVDLASARPSGSFVPVMTQVPGSTAIYVWGFQPDDDQYLFMNFHNSMRSPTASYSDTYDKNDMTDPVIRTHLHWMPNDDAVGDVVIQFEYQVSVLHEGMQDPVLVEKVVTTPGAIAEQITGLTEIPNDELTQQSIIVCRIARMGSDVRDTYTGTMLGFSIDAYVPIDSLGAENRWGDE